MRGQTIATVWCIDVEPDATVPTAGERRWTGFADLVAAVERVRPQLEARTGAPVRVAWFVRMDPMIEAIYGRADHAVREHAECFDRLAATGDAVGLHVHPFRFEPERAVWYSDHTDPDWVRACIASSVAAYTAAFARAPTIIRMGGYYLPGAAADAMIEHGLRVDLTAEPGRGRLRDDPSHGAFATGPSTDFTAFPRERYRPSTTDLSTPASTAVDARALTLVPLTAYDTRSRLVPRHRAIARRVIRRGPRYGPLNPWRDWPSPQWFWDCAAAAAKEVGDDHLAFASRTLATDDPGAVNQHRVLDALVDHPLVTRLRFVDPLDLELDRNSVRAA
jgi:hypothetical protein